MMQLTDRYQCKRPGCGIVFTRFKYYQHLSHYPRCNAFKHGEAYDSHDGGSSFSGSEDGSSDNDFDEDMPDAAHEHLDQVQASSPEHDTTAGTPSDASSNDSEVCSVLTEELGSDWEDGGVHEEIDEFVSDREDAPPAEVGEGAVTETCCRLERTMVLTRGVGAHLDTAARQSATVADLYESRPNWLLGDCADSLAATAYSCDGTNCALEASFNQCKVQFQVLHEAFTSGAAGWAASLPARPLYEAAHVDLPSYQAYLATCAAWQRHDRLVARAAACVAELQILVGTLQQAEGDFSTLRARMKAWQPRERGKAVKRLQSKLKSPLFPGCGRSLLDAVFFLLQWRHTHKCGRDAMNLLLRFLATMLPRGSNFVCSLHVAQRVIGVEDWSKYELHICCNSSCKGNGHVWPHLPQKDWSSHKDDLCPHCKAPRFERSLVTGKTVLRPVSWYIDLGIDNVIQNCFFGDPEWVTMFNRRPLPPAALMDEMVTGTVDKAWSEEQFSGTRRVCSEGDFWVSKEADRLRRVLPVVRSNGMSILDHESTTCWELGIDWVQPFNASRYSTGLLVLRCSSLSEMDRNKAINCKILAVLPGPKEPQSVDVHLRRTAEILLQHAPMLFSGKLQSEDPPAGPQSSSRAAGVPLSPKRLKARMPVQLPGQQGIIEIWLCLTGILADSIARCKLSKENSVGAYYCCGACTFSGALYPGLNKQTVYYKGYAKVAEQYRDAGVARPCELFVPQKFHKTDKDARDLATACVGKSAKYCRRWGYKGLSYLHSVLPYLSYVDVWLMPVGHALLFGVVKNFVDRILVPCKTPEETTADETDMEAVELLQAASQAGPSTSAAAEARSATAGGLGRFHLSKQALRLVAAAARDFVVTSEFGKRYKDVLKYRNSWTMEDWFSFVETYSAHVFRETVFSEGRQLDRNDWLQALWADLVALVEHYCRPGRVLTNEYLGDLPKGPFPKGTQESSDIGLRLGMKFARRMEQEGFPDADFTYNLHLVCCRLPRQEAARGHVAKDMEFGLERIMQEYKSHVSRRVSGEPEKTYVNRVLCEVALKQLLRSEQRFVELRKEVLTASPSKTLPPGYDRAYQDGPGVHGATEHFFLRGGGRSPDTSLIQSIAKALEVLLRTNRPMSVPGWADTNGNATAACLAQALSALESGRVAIYYSAQCGPFCVSCSGFESTKSRSNHFIRVDYVVGQREVGHAAVVKAFVKVLRPEHSPGGAALRFALVDIFQMGTPQDRMLVVPNKVSKDLAYPVLLENVTAKLVLVAPNGYDAYPKKFVEYTNVGIMPL